MGTRVLVTAVMALGALVGFRHTGTCPASESESDSDSDSPELDESSPPAVLACLAALVGSVLSWDRFRFSGAAVAAVSEAGGTRDLIGTAAAAAGDTLRKGEGVSRAGVDDGEVVCTGRDNDDMATVWCAGMVGMVGMAGLGGEPEAAGDTWRRAGEARAGEACRREVSGEWPCVGVGFDFDCFAVLAEAPFTRGAVLGFPEVRMCRRFLTHDCSRSKRRLTAPLASLSTMSMHSSGLQASYFPLKHTPSPPACSTAALLLASTDSEPETVVSADAGKKSYLNV